MKTRSFFALSLLAVLLLVSCAPADVPALAEPQAPAQPTEPVVEEPPTEVAPVVAPTEVPPTEAAAPAPEPVFVSRGPDLEATEPSTVSLAAGDLQLVEFFRFT